LVKFLAVLVNAPAQIGFEAVGTIDALRGFPGLKEEQNRGEMRRRKLEVKD
jgi:hypothetical protein